MVPWDAGSIYLLGGENLDEKYLVVTEKNIFECYKKSENFQKNIKHQKFQKSQFSKNRKSKMLKIEILGFFC